MKYKEFAQKFGASFRTKHMLKRGMELPKWEALSTPPSGIPMEFIRLDPWEGEYLYAVARRAKCGILEIGRFNGGSTFLLACANTTVPIYSIDIKPQDDGLLQSLFDEHKVGGNVHLIVGDSGRFGYRQRTTAFDLDLLFVDGDHSYQGCSADLATWHGNVRKGGHIVFHDAYLGSYGVQDAILDFLASHPECETVASPYIGPTHWHQPAGSIAHLMKT